MLCCAAQSFGGVAAGSSPGCDMLTRLGWDTPHHTPSPFPPRPAGGAAGPGAVPGRHQGVCARGVPQRHPQLWPHALLLPGLAPRARPQHRQDAQGVCGVVGGSRGCCFSMQVAASALDLTSDTTLKVGQRVCRGSYPRVLVSLVAATPGHNTDSTACGGEGRYNLHWCQARRCTWTCISCAARHNLPAHGTILPPLPTRCPPYSCSRMCPPRPPPPTHRHTFFNPGALQEARFNRHFVRDLTWSATSWRSWRTLTHTPTHTL